MSYRYYTNVFTICQIFNTIVQKSCEIYGVLTQKFCIKCQISRPPHSIFAGIGKPFLFFRQVKPPRLPGVSTAAFYPTPLPWQGFPAARPSAAVLDARFAGGFLRQKLIRGREHVRPKRKPFFVFISLPAYAFLAAQSSPHTIFAGIGKPFLFFLQGQRQGLRISPPLHFILRACSATKTLFCKKTSIIERKRRSRMPVPNASPFVSQPRGASSDFNHVSASGQRRPQGIG